MKRTYQRRITKEIKKYIDDNPKMTVKQICDATGYPHEVVNGYRCSTKKKERKQEMWNTCPITGWKL